MNYPNNTYIYESPDNGETVYKRKFMDYEHRTVIKQPAIRDKNTKTQTQPDSNLFENLLSYLQK